MKAPALLWASTQRPHTQRQTNSSSYCLYTIDPDDDNNDEQGEESIADMGSSLLEPTMGGRRGIIVTDDGLFDTHLPRVHSLIKFFVAKINGIVPVSTVGQSFVLLFFNHQWNLLSICFTPKRIQPLFFF